MDNEEFVKYMQGFIALLFPNALNQLGRRVLLKVDSGPCRMNLKLLASLKLLGIVLHPCIPNTTHITQETDQLYRPFKTQLLKNLDLIIEARLDNNKSLLLAPKMVGLPLFGGVDWETGLKVETDAFQKAFVPLQCIPSWRKVGAVAEDGITRACLDNPQVMKAIGDGNEDTDQLHLAIQMASDLAIHALTMGGCNAQWLKVMLKKKKVVEESICVPNTAPHC